MTAIDDDLKLLSTPPSLASVVRDRTPIVKYHSMARAKSSVGYELYNDKARGGRIYEWQPDEHEWWLLYDIAPNTPLSDLPWRKSRYADFEAREQARKRWSRQFDLDGGTTASAGAGS